MAIPTLTPASEVSAIVLPRTGSASTVASQTPIGVYDTSQDFLSGAADQVNYTYQKLGGDILDIELTTGSVYSAYEEAVLEYSYIVNMHQSKNVLSEVLGMTTGTFDHRGSLKSGALSSSLSGTHVALKYPRVTLALNEKYSEGYSTHAGIGGATTIYSASFKAVDKVQDYNLGAIVLSASNNNYDEATGGTVPYSGLVTGKKIVVNRVYYKSPSAMWRFFGYYGGLNTVGNLANYGQYADDSTFQLVPVWQNKAQAMSFEDAIYTRNSHYSYELENNNLRIFPQPVSPGSTTPTYYHFDFRIVDDAWSTEQSGSAGINGINNMNTLPFANVPYGNINSIGKQWIRRFALALSKETLGQVRSKLSSIPIPGESVTLNGPALISEAREEQNNLRTELKEVFDQLTYQALAAKDADISNNIEDVSKKIPAGIFVG
ncbi:MAG TPA: hypothetical protein DCM40_03910 [Maribacter sp.]|nr:hypothetical protein [Maribacter sp.]